MIERVRRAASSSMSARSSSAGGTISRSLSSLSQRGLHADAVEHLEEPVDLLDAGDACAASCGPG